MNYKTFIIVPWVRTRKRVAKFARKLGGVAARGFSLNFVAWNKYLSLGVKSWKLKN